MKSRAVLVGAAIFGTAIGTGMTAVEMTNSHNLFYLEDFEARAAERKSERQVVRTEKMAQAEVVGSDEYKFGSMERFSKQRHTFRIRNVGDAALMLNTGRSTCKCTLFEIDRETCKPGEEAEILVEWTGQTQSRDPEFSQSVDVITNDPDREIVRLFVSGLVTETVRALPEDLIVGRVSSNTGTELDFRLFGFRGDKIEILESEFENQEIADKFELHLEPLSEEELAKEKGGKLWSVGQIDRETWVALGTNNPDNSTENASRQGSHDSSARQWPDDQ